MARTLMQAHNPRLSAIASRVELNASAKVNQAIDDKNIQHSKEKADEMLHKYFCTDQFYLRRRSVRSVTLRPRLRIWN